MSGSTIGGVVGGAVGFFVGGPAGAQWGWMIGSAVGGYVDPTRIEGPRLTDARSQTSRDGIPIPFGWGVFPVAGNVIWQQPDISEHENEQSGKGGGTEQVTYTYTRSYAIGICEGPITGLLQIRRNGKLVYDARDDATLEAEYTSFGMTLAQALSRITGQRAENARFMDRCVRYLGDETQGPDPTIEGYLGVGNVPSYRGLAYIVVTDDETTAGEIAQYEFVVAACGTATAHTSGTEWIGTHTSGFLKESPDGIDWSEAATTINLQGGGEFTPAGSGFLHNHGGQVLGISASTGPFGGTPRAFRDSDGVWHPLFGSWPAGNGTHKIIHTGTHWMVARHLGGGIAASTDPINVAFTDTGFSYQSICNLGSNVLCAYATGTSFDIVTFRILTSSGSSASVPPSINVGYVARNAVLAEGSGITALVLEEHYGSGSVDRRVHIHSSSDSADTWEEHDSPFPDFPAPASWPAVQIQYSPTMGVWMVCAKDRIAVGATLGALTMLADSVSGDIEGIDEDGRKFVICCDDGGVYAWTPSDGLEALSSGTSETFMDVVALGDMAGATPMPDAPGYYVDENGNLTGENYETVAPCTPTLGDIVADLCDREGLTSDEYDVSELTDLVPGFVVARETDAASVIGALTTAYFFDPGEWDGKLRFVKRGGTSAFAINGDDLVERDGDAFERERVQEAELLRRVTIGYVDPAANYGPTTQKWERRAGTVQALGEASFEVPVTLEADDAATIAKRRGLTAWGEPEKQKFSLPYRLSALTPTDIITYTDADGEVHTLRLMQAEDDSGIRYMESATNCAEAYNASATGVTPKPPTISEADLIGPTKLVVMDLPLWRNSDADDLGLYAAASGYFNGWTGSQADISTDGGASYTQSVQLTSEATIGYTTTALTAWVDSETPEEQEVTVYLPEAPSSVSYETLLQYANKAAVQLDSGAWEILQYQTVTALGDDLYTLSGLVRGRFNTTPGVVSADATFVLLDDAVQFVRAERDSLGITLTLRATSYGTSSDAAVPFDFDFADGVSQTEWPVHDVEASRDGSDNVTVTWIGRARRGTETSPYHSTHFTGYRVTYSDGESYDVGTTTTTHTRSSAPASQTITVSPLNDITGAGPASAGVLV